ncbi:hypothetical protein lerEdw1_015906 [Lerista edwardsae]|nr:hypothetical protein lerEdw1_015906 [Lerista edwardsae]
MEPEAECANLDDPLCCFSRASCSWLPLLCGVTMEKQNPTVPQNERPEGTGEASHVPQPRGISETPPRTEEGEEDHSAGRAPRWEDQWLQFLGRVKSQGMLEEEEEALWGEAKVILQVPSSKSGVDLLDLGRSALCGFVRIGLDAIVVRCPLEKQNPTGPPPMERLSGTEDESHLPQPSSVSESPPRSEEGEEDHSAGRALRWEAQWLDFLERVKSREMLEEEALWGEAKVAAGSSSSAVWKSPPGLGQEEDGKQSIVGGLMPDSENEGEQPGMFWEREEEETLQGWERVRGPEEMMDELIPWLREAFEAQEQETEERGDRSWSSLHAEEGLKSPLLLEEGVIQISTPGAGVMPDSENEGGQPGTLLERDEEETLPSGESSRRQEGSPAEEMREGSIPSVGRAFQEQENRTEEENYNSQEALQIPNEKQLEEEQEEEEVVKALASVSHICPLLLQGVASWGLDPHHSTFLSFVEISSFLQLAAIVVQYPMEKQNPTVPQNERPVGTGEGSHVPQPRGIGESPPRTEAGEEDLSAGWAPRWEDQWLDFLERVKSQGMLEEEEEEALWDEAKVLLASLEPETQVYWRPWDKSTERLGIAWLLSDCENEGDQFGMLLERDEEETLRGSANEMDWQQIEEEQNPVGLSVLPVPVLQKGL